MKPFSTLIPNYPFDCSHGHGSRRSLAAVALASTLAFAGGAVAAVPANLEDTAVPHETVLQQPADAIAEMTQPATESVVPASPMVELNRASAAELAARLPGVGPALAANIVNYRDTHGPFSAIESLLAVKGIGERTVERLRPLITVDVLPGSRAVEREAKAAVQAVVRMAEQNAAAAAR